MTILITGVTGFVGGWLLECANKRFAGTCTEFILLSSREIKGYNCILHKGYSFDASDFTAAGVGKIDAVIHIGAYVGQSPEKYYSAKMNFTTVKNTEYLLEHLPNLPEIFVLCSSIDVYGLAASCKEVFNPEIIEKIDENRPPMPMNNYAMAKLFSEEIVTEWAKEHGVLAHMLRLGNQYGPGDKRRFFINAMAEKAAAGQPLTLTAHPQVIRNYIYVEDTCNFILNSLAVKENVGPVNLVSRRNPTMLEIAEEFSKLSGYRSEVFVQPPQVLYGKNVIYNSEKREKLLGQEQYTLESGLCKYFEYLKDGFSSSGKE